MQMPMWVKIPSCARPRESLYQRGYFWYLDYPIGIRKSQGRSQELYGDEAC